MLPEKRATSKASLFLLLLAALLYIGLTAIPAKTAQQATLLPHAKAAPTEHAVGRQTKIRRVSFKSTPPDVPTYTPSQEATALAVRQSHGDNSWFHYAPKGDTPAPVIILFHGSGHSGLSMIDMWKEIAQEQGLILLAPNARGRSWGMSDFTVDSLNMMLDTAQTHRPIDRERIFLFGDSNGGSFVTLLLNQFDGPWQAGAVHGGFASADNITAPLVAKPLRIYLGDKDHIFRENAANATLGAMARAGHNVALHMIPDHTHWFYDIGPQIASDSWDWFRSLHRMQ